MNQTEKVTLVDGSESANLKPRKLGWKQDPEAVKADILRVATDEFAAHGLSGGRIDEIARQTQASKRMIYYYFTDKEGLYRAVLESVYTALRGAEERLDIEGLAPVDGLRKLVEATFDGHASNPHFIRLVMIENIHNAQYLRQSKIIQSLNRTIIDKLAALCDRGIKAGLFRAEIDPLQLHWMMSSMSFYNISNRATFSTSFGDDLFQPDTQKALRAAIVDQILSSVVIGYTSKAADEA